MLTLTREQLRRVDQLAVEELGMPSLILMENAGRSAATVALDLLRTKPGFAPAKASAAILCGGGNNGGDGYVIARHLHNAGVPVTIYAAKPVDQLTGDAAVNAHIAQNMKLEVEPIDDPAELSIDAEAWKGVDLIVDALLGTGFTGEVRPPIRGVIERCNSLLAAARTANPPKPSQRPSVLSVDLPSGMDCDTGQAGGVAMIADVTVTFVAPKTGCIFPEANALLGRVAVGDIGVPPELVQRIAAGG